MSIIICPVCGGTLSSDNNRVLCSKGHSFDISKEGYINLLYGSHKSGKLTGDSRDMARSRRDFLSRGYFDPLLDELQSVIGPCADKASSVLDICCGEGYYSSSLSERLPCSFFGFDLSKEMVRLAAKRRSKCRYFVANMAHIPVADASFDVAMHLFAPFNSSEFARVLKQGGTLISVIPAKRHLFGLKQVLYDRPYENDEKPHDAPDFTLCETRRIRAEITLSNNDDIMSLLKMTPYFYHTPSEKLRTAEQLGSLDTEIEFIMNIYKK